MKKRMIPILCGLLTLCLLLAGCSGKTQSAAYDSAPREVNQMKSDNSYSAAEESSYDAPAAGLQEANQDSSSLIGSVPGRKIIKNADMNVETRTFDEFIAYVNKALGELGGYIQSSSLNGSRYGREDLRYASITLRVPAEKLESFLSMIEGEGNVTYRNIYTDDVTLSYVDTESHLKALRTEQETLLGLLEKASFGSPYIMLFVCIAVIAGFTGSATGGLAFVLDNFTDKLVAMGGNPEALTRIANISQITFDSLPHNSAIVLTLSYCGVTHKEGYKHLFVVTVVTTTLATIVNIIMAHLGVI